MKTSDLPWIMLLLVVLLTGCGAGNDNEAESEEAAVNSVSANDEADAGIFLNEQLIPSPILSGESSASGTLMVFPVGTPGKTNGILNTASLNASALVDALSMGDLYPQNIPFIEGAWQQDCTQGENGESYNSRVIYQDGKVHLYAHNYSDSQCQNTLARIQMWGRYSLGQAAQLESGEQVNLLWQNIDTIKAAYYGAVVISTSNEMQLCGIDNWSHGELRDVSDCHGFDIQGMQKNIIKVTGEQLIYGDSNSRGLDDYPSQLEEDVLFYKAPTQLEGNWLQECKVVGQSGQSRYLEVVGNSILEEWTLFSDTSCDNILLSQTNAYQIELGQNQILASGENITQFYLQLFASQFTLHTNEISDYFNHTQSALDCGSMPWQVNELKDVLECLNIQRAFPASSRNIFKVTENDVTFGDENFIGVNGFSIQLEAQRFIRQ